MDELSELRQQRIDKVKALEEKGIRAYPIRYKREQKISQVIENFDEANPKNVKIAGRIKAKRPMGKAAFINVEDMSGNIQVYAKGEQVGADAFEMISTLDLGDIVGVEGETFKTQKGEMSVRVKEMKLLSKCIRPLPVVKEKDGQLFDEFADKEMKYRQRYVDLIVNAKTRQDFIIRSKAVSAIRRFLDGREFLEVETPMMHPIAGGAAARPFTTHHNALDMKLFMRIAP